MNEEKKGLEIFTDLKVEEKPVEEVKEEVKENDILASLAPPVVSKEEDLNLDDSLIFDQEIPISASTEIEEKNITNADVMSSMNVNLSEVERFDNPNQILKNERHISTNDELLEFFIGDNLDKIKNKKLNFSAFLLNMFYFMYRKLFLYGIGMFLVNLVIVYFTKNIMIELIIYGVYSIISCILFNNLYLKNAKKKIDKLKNRGVNFIEDSCSKSGGTNIIIPIIFLLIYIIFMIFIFMGLDLNINL